MTTSGGHRLLNSVLINLENWPLARQKDSCLHSIKREGNNKGQVKRTLICRSTTLPGSNFIKKLMEVQ